MAGNLEQLLADVLSIYRAGEATVSTEEGDLIPYPDLVNPPIVGPEDEKTIAAVMRTLRRVTAIAERAAVLPPPPPSTIYAVLSSAELLMRWECLAGRSKTMLRLLPAFTFLATGFFLDRALALRKSHQVRNLVETADFDAR